MEADPSIGVPAARIGVNQADPLPGVINLDPGYLDPALLPTELMASCTARVVARWGGQALGYGANPGPAPLREALAARVASPCTAANVVTTAGTSAALNQLAVRLAADGRALLTEASTYDLGRRIFEARGVPLHAVPGPVDDIDVDAFALAALRAARDSGLPPALYLIPTFHNPTGRVLGVERRRELVALAERLGLLVIEDQAYAELSFGLPPPPPLWSLAPDPERVVTLYSFAKCLAPGLRAGWLVTGERRAAELADDPERRSGGGASHFTMMALMVACLDGDLDRRLAVLRDQLRLRRDTLLDLLSRDLPPGHRLTAPGGGFFAWVSLPSGTNAEGLRQAARARGVVYADGRRFGAEPGIRLCFAACAPAQLREAATVLMETWHRAGEPLR